MKSICLSALCFIVGLGASVGWRLKMMRDDASPPLQKVMRAIATTDAKNDARNPATQTKEKTVYGRNECIEGLAKALAAPTGGAWAKDVKDWADRLAVTDPFLACEMLLKTKKTDARDNVLWRCLRAAMKSDAFRAFALFAKSGATVMQGDLRRDIMKLMIAKDAKQTWDTLAADSGGRVSKADTETIAAEWGRTQGYAAATFGLALRDPMQRATFLRKGLSAWAGGDAVSFAKWFRQQPGDLALGRFVRFDGSSSENADTFAALDAAVSLDLPVESSSLGSAFESAWRNPALRDQAPEWITRQTDPAVRDAAWDRLARQYLETDATRATGLMGNIQDEKLRGGLSSTIAAEMAKTDAAGALNFAASLADDESREKAAASALATWAKHQPAESLAYASTHAETLNYQHLAYVASEWGRADPVAAMELFHHVAPDMKENYSMQRIAREWIERRPDEVDAWLAEAQAGRVKDVVAAQRSTPARGANISASTIYYGPGIETHIEHGVPGKSSTSTVISGRTVKYYY